MAYVLTFAFLGLYSLRREQRFIGIGIHKINLRQSSEVYNGDSYTHKTALF